jgi:5-methylcytosine-specific restriction protein A
MSTAPLAYCAMHGCPQKAASRGFCLSHANQQLEQTRPNIELRKLYRTARWRRLRDIVLFEEPVCVECLAEGFRIASHDVHHLEKATLHNFWDRNNLQALCVRHHSMHTKRGE